MLTWLRRWRPRHLLASWLAYWLLLIVVTLGGAILAAWRVTHLPDGHGNISANFGDGVFSLIVSEGTKTIWQGSASLISIALLVAGPPLLLWFLRILSQRRQPVSRPETRRAERV
jgi:hypothetical protein